MSSITPIKEFKIEKVIARIRDTDWLLLPRAKAVAVTAKTMHIGMINPIPPIVGVPLFRKCHFGPSSYIGCLAICESFGIIFLVIKIVKVSVDKSNNKYIYDVSILISYSMRFITRLRLILFDAFARIISFGEIVLHIWLDVISGENISLLINILFLSKPLSIAPFATYLT